MKPLGTVGGRACWSLIALTLVATGCGSRRSNPAARPPRARTLRVAAASDLQVALPALAERFTEESGVKTSLTFGASGQLAEQIKQGAPFDVFLAANQSFVNDLAAAGFIPPDSVRPYARGTLVLVVAPRVRALDPEAVGPAAVGGEEDRARQPRLRAVRGRRQAGAGAGGPLAGGGDEDRSGRNGAPGLAVRPVGQRRGRSRGRSRSPTCPRSASSRSIPSSTTRSCRAWASSAHAASGAGREIHPVRPGCRGAGHLIQVWFLPGRVGPLTGESGPCAQCLMISAPLWLSLRVAALATLLIVALGIPLALLLARGRFPGKGLLAGFLTLPLVLPPTVLGYYLLQLLGRRAWLGLWLERTWGVDHRLPLVGGGGGVRRGGVPALPAAGAGGDRERGPGARGRGAAAGTERVFGVLVDHAARSPGAGWRPGPCSRSPAPSATSARR